MKNTTTILIIMGMIALMYSEIDYYIQENLLDFNNHKSEKERMLNWPPIIGIALLLTGVIIEGTQEKKIRN